MNSISGKKLLFVITKSNWGGAQAYTYLLATQLKDRGAEVVVALGGTGLPGASTGLLKERLDAANIRTIVLSSFARDVSIMREVKAFKELYRVVQNEKPDILHLNSSKAGGLGAFVGSLLKVPKIVFTAHGWPHREPRPLPARTLIWLVSWATILFSTNTIVLFSLDYTGAPVFFSRKKLSIVHNGIALFDFLSKDTARNALAIQGNIPPAKNWIIMQAELHKNKGIDIAIDAFAQIAAAHQDTILIVMGEGEERAKLEAQILERKLADRVFLVGFVKDSCTYLPAGNIFLMSSRKEGMPMALLEAGTVGLPIVSTNVGGIPEMIQDGKDGLLVAPNNVDALARALNTLLEDSNLAHKLSSSFTERIVKEFSQEKMIAETIAVYTK